MDNNDEMVLCIPSSLIDFQGFMHLDNNFDWMYDLTRSDAWDFRRRSRLEEDDSYKQIVTYSIIQYAPILDFTPLILSYTRGKSGGEDRLKKLKSIGIGGHVNNEEWGEHPGIARFIRHHALREINEEVSIPGNMLFTTQFQMEGLINDNSNPVGRVHLGFVYRLLLPLPVVDALESSISDPEMLSYADIYKNKESYESWSQILIEGLGIK